MAITAPPVDELTFLKITANHNEFANKLQKLGWNNSQLNDYVQHVGVAWFLLGDQHLSEAEVMSQAGIQRATHSRAYYAAYNASKGVRYLVVGFFSLKGDDHGKAGELPDDFPDKVTWAKKIAALYENRLRADYDNWTSTTSEFTQTPADAVSQAKDFIKTSRDYLKMRFGLHI